jgi:hypothetical protein
MVQFPEPRSTRKEEGRDPLPLGPYPAAVQLERTELFALSRARIHGFHGVPPGPVHAWSGRKRRAIRSPSGAGRNGSPRSGLSPVREQLDEDEAAEVTVGTEMSFGSDLRRRFLLRGSRRGFCQRFANAAGNGRQHEARRGGWRGLEPRVRQRQATTGNVRQNVVANLKTGRRNPTRVRIPPPPSFRTSAQFPWLRVLVEGG